MLKENAEGIIINGMSFHCIMFADAIELVVYLEMFNKMSHRV